MRCGVASFDSPGRCIFTGEVAYTIQFEVAYPATENAVRCSMIHYPAIANPTQTLVRDVSSAHVKQDYRLFISLPQNYTGSEKRFPVLYVLDGNGMFALVKSIIEIQQISQSVPELIIVGIGYPTKTYRECIGLRGRDFTPVELTPEQKAGIAYPFEETGGASRFFAFIAEELIPSIDREFRTDSDDRALTGFSLGSVFALYALFHYPVLFSRLVAVSPGIPFDYWVDGVLDTEKAYAKQHSSLPVRVFIGVESSGNGASIEQVENCRQFVKRIGERNYQALETRFQIFEGTDHTAVGPVGLTYGIRDVYR
jgi:uncharacterized protein